MVLRVWPRPAHPGRDAPSVMSETGQAVALILSPTPPPPDIPRRFEDRFRGKLVFPGLPGLRRAGLRARLGPLLKTRTAPVVITPLPPAFALLRHYPVALA